MDLSRTFCGGRWSDRFTEGEIWDNFSGRLGKANSCNVV